LHALLWGVFSVGGFIAAFLLPILIYVNNIAYPLGLWPVTSRDPTRLLVTDQIVSSLFVFVTIAGSLFHGVYRFQKTLGELGLKKYEDRIIAIGYAIIAVGISALLYYLLFLNPSFVRMLTPH
jgi:fumarate reductase subunit D